MSRSGGFDAAPAAAVGGWLVTDLVDITSDLAALDGSGFWVVVLPYDGPPVCARFATRRPLPRLPSGRWHGPTRDAWTSSLDPSTWAAAVADIRAAIAAGDVYQVNLTRRLSAPLPAGADVFDLAGNLDLSNPAPHCAVVRIPGAAVACASPELFLRRDNRHVESRPIKGTAADPTGFLPKDRAENVMIVDLVRNDLGRVCSIGSVRVPELCRIEQHPGLAHLVSTVTGELRRGVGWAELIEATFPPGSVTGAPKVTAMAAIERLEPVARDVYCGAVGWVDADRSRGDLAVAIRTFWVAEGRLNLGTGGAITWDSSAAGEWDETALKAANLLRTASPEGPQQARAKNLGVSQFSLRA